ncbi:MAG: SRPBCC family protein, partial [Actinomycetes bacterium]
MKVNGEAVLHARAEEVWAALVDPAVLVATIPGCESLELIGGDRYRMSVTAGVASIKGTYAGEVELADQRPPRSFLLRASGSGSPGTVRADVLVGLEPQETGSTRLTYEADAVVGGMVGGVGQRMLASVAKRTAGEFFAAVDAVLRNGGVPAAAPAQAGPALEPGAGGSTPVSGEV